MMKIPDAEVIQVLQSGKRNEVNRIFGYLCQQVQAQVAHFVEGNKGLPNDTQDVLQDGLFAFFKLAQNGSLEKIANIEAYLFSICKNLWLQQLRKKKEIVPLEEKHNDLAVKEVPLFNLIKGEEQESLKQLMGQLGEGCQSILVYFYYKKIRMKEIADVMGFSSEQVAKNKKSECLKKLRKLMLDSPIFKNRIKQGTIKK